MCGIAGVCCRNSANPENAKAAVERMVRGMHHRGPDDQGSEMVCAGEGKVFLGNARLAILDLSHAGHQPMRDTKTGNWCVLNGEIYNHLEIRRELGGVRWQSTSDTETLLHAYAAWGRSCVERLRGMFAIALYDASQRKLWCVRDRLGIKPFYYATGENAFVFASEVKVLLASGMVPYELDRDALAAYMRFGSVVEPLTLLRDIHSLAPGHWMEVENGVIARHVEYWSLSSCVDGGITQRGERTRELMQSSVREHMLADVPVACFLSGGVDSSVVTSCASRESATPLRTFTVAFQGTTMDESSEARAIAKRFGTEHTEVRLTDTEVAAHVPEAVTAMDLPSIDGINTFIVSRAVRANGIKVVLSGLGGDELFGGYRSFRLLPIAMKWAGWMGHLPRAFSSLFPGGERGFEMMRPGISLAERYGVLRALWHETELHRMGMSTSQRMIAETDSALPINTQISLLELDVYMRSVLLRDSDVMSMAHSIELRVPFLDHRLVEHALQNHLAGRGKKDVLLSAYSTEIPELSVARPKRGFELPMANWFRGILRDFCDQGLAELDREAILPVPTSEYRSQFYSGRLTWPRLWQLVVLGHWLRRFNDSRLEQGSRAR